MATRYVFLSSALALVFVAVACGSDDSPADVDAGTDECVGFACPEHQEIAHLPEGGEVRLELVRQDRFAPEIRTYAWFADDQQPQLRPYARQPETWHLSNLEEGCSDMRVDEFYPAGEVDSRSYLDAGETVTFSTDGAEFSLDRRTDTQDDVTFMWHDIVYKTHLSPSEVAEGPDYDIVLDGGDGIPAMTFEGTLRLPPTLDPEFPDMDRTVYMPADQNFTFVPQDQEYEDFDYSFVGFGDQYGPVGFCIGPPGEITISKEFLEVLPRGGNVQFGTLNHRAIEYEGRRIDFVGINCREAQYLVDDTHL